MSDSSTPAAAGAAGVTRSPQRVVIVPGNGCAEVDETTLWYVNVGRQLSALGCDVRVRTMPDPVSGTIKWRVAAA